MATSLDTSTHTNQSSDPVRLDNLVSNMMDSPSSASSLTFPSPNSFKPEGLLTPSSQGTLEDPEESDKVLGVAILAQLQELDAAIKHQELNKVDGRKTRWIEHRKLHGTSIKSEPGSPVTSPKKKRCSVGSATKHKKENIGGQKTPVKRLSPLKTPVKVKVSSSLVNENNNSPVFPKLSTNPVKMKIEVSEPMVGSVEPSNVLETMKQHFINDTTQNEHINGAKLTNGYSEEPKDSANDDKKKKTSFETETRKKKPLPLKKDVKRLTNATDKTKIKVDKLVATQAVNPNKNITKDMNISNFFVKQKIKGLREVRKPDDETSNALSPAVPSQQPRKCLLIAAAAKMITSSLDKKSERKNGRGKPTVMRLEEKMDKLKKVKKMSNGAEVVVTSAIAPVIVPKPNGTAVDSSDVSDTEIIIKKARGRPSKRKLNGDSNSSPNKCKKTSTVVAEVHNTMNGEPQSSIPVQCATKKKRATSPSKGSNSESTNPTNNESPSVVAQNSINKNKKKGTSSFNKGSILSPLHRIQKQFEMDNQKSSETVSPTPTSPSKPISQASPPSSKTVNHTVVSKTLPLFVRSVSNINENQSNNSDNSPSESKLPSCSSSPSIKPSSPIKRNKNSQTNESFTENNQSNPVNESTNSSLHLHLDSDVSIIADDSKKTVDSSQHGNGEVNRTKSPTGSDCDNNNSTESTSKSKEKSVVSTDSSAKAKRNKCPKYLSNLFKDEGIQNMLKSIETDSPAIVADGSTNGDNGAVKLRPKRGASSPEPDILEVVYSSNKRKRKVNEVDSLFTDEGTLNLLTSLNNSSRRSLSALPDGTSPANAISVADTSLPVRAKRGRPLKVRANFNKVKANFTPVCISQMNEVTVKKECIGVSSKAADAPKPLGNQQTPAQEKKQVPEKKQLAAPEKRPVAEKKTFTEGRVNGKELILSSPVRMRRVDLPTSPTAASLKSLVRSLEETNNSGAAVPTSSVAFDIHSRPGTSGSDILPPTRRLKGLMDSTGNTGLSSAPSSGLSSFSGLRQSQRQSVRQSAEYGGIGQSNQYRDIILRRMNKFVHIVMAPQTTKIKNSLNTRVLRELCDALHTLKSDPSVRLVLLTSNGSSFCQGVDITSLHHSNAEVKASHALNLTKAIKDFLRMLVQFPKPIIAGVNGSAMGLGVTMLPLFDMVFASDAAEFYLPYFKLGQVPEGGATYTFPNLLGKLQSTRLFMGHKFSASESVSMGLVSEVIWPANFQETLLPKVALLASQSAQSMEATKALMNHHLLTKLELSVEAECHALHKQWLSPQFETLSKRFLETHSPLMQKPLPVPL